MKGKSDKDITIAQMSLKQALAVAIIGLCSALAVAMINRYDKPSPAKPDATEQIGFYEGRAVSVEQGFDQAEKAVGSLTSIAEKRGDKEEVKRLTQFGADTRTKRAQFQLLHKRHLEALQYQGLVEASKIRLEANELLWIANDEWRELRRTTAALKAYINAMAIRDLHRIPLYGKGLGPETPYEVAE